MHSPPEPARRANNSFDVLRLIAAFAVLWSHQHALLALPEPMFPGLGVTYGGFGVFIFFVISGYLNTGSLLRGQAALAFLVNRALRIYPALMACTLVMVCLGAVATSLSLSQFFTDTSVLTFVVRNFVLLLGAQFELPRVFESNPYPHAINGSLWTLPYEMHLYLMLALVLAAARYRTYTMYVVFAAVVCLQFLGVGAPDQKIFPGISSGHMLTFATLFVAGGFIASCERAQILAVGLGLCVAVGLCALSTGHDPFGRVMLFSVAIIIFGWLEPPAWLRPRLDLSYGIYLYAFPAQQVAVALFPDFWSSLLVATCLTVALALASAVIIERPALRLKIRSGNPRWLPVGVPPQQSSDAQ